MKLLFNVSSTPMVTSFSVPFSRMTPNSTVYLQTLLCRISITAFPMIQMGFWTYVIPPTSNVWRHASDFRKSMTSTYSCLNLALSSVILLWFPSWAVIWLIWPSGRYFSAGCAARCFSEAFVALAFVLALPYRWHDAPRVCILELAW